MLFNILRYAPDADVRCICKGPEETASRHQIVALPMRDMASTTPPRARNRIVRALRRIVVGVPTEVRRCASAVRLLKDTDMLVMTGTGMLGDFGIVPFDLHYDILRWSVIAKLCRCKLLFVSVGAGPIRKRVSRWFVKWSLSLADYRSYRDRFSKEYLASIGFDTNGDAVYPDLAFSLPPALLPAHRTREGRNPVVGVGLMTPDDGHHPQRADAAYRAYVSALARFVTWLLEHEYTVRLLIGDVRYDARVRDDLRTLLEARGVKAPAGRLLDDPIASADDILSQIAAADVVVASRFHNVLLALMLGKPVVAISYHEKIRSLMSGLGLQEYCHDIDRLDVSRLIEQLAALEHHGDQITFHMNQQTSTYRTALDTQYDRIFGMVESAGRRQQAATRRYQEAR